MTIRQYLYACLAMLVVWLLSGSFIAGTFDITTWGGMEKSMLIIIWVCKCVWLFIVYENPIRNSLRHDPREK